MPKIVDHDARRAELAGALWRVISREGVAGASVRNVAAEAGWSAGAVRYYFATQDALLRFGIDLQLQGIPRRLRTHLATAPGRERALALLGELLPLDETRMGEARVWFAALTTGRADDLLRDIRLLGLHGERTVCRLAICDLLGHPHPEDPFEPLDPSLELEVEKLHAAIDGLCVNAAAQPNALPAERVEQLMTAIVDDLQARLLLDQASRGARQ